MSTPQDDFIKLPKTGKVTDDFALDADRRKAYQIFLYSAIGSIVFTSILYGLTFLF